MHATVHFFRQPAGTPPAHAAGLAERLHGTAPIGGCTIVPIGGTDGAVIAFFGTAGEAGAAVDRPVPGGVVWQDRGAYRVLHQHTGIDAARSPQIAHVVCFDGPRSDARAAATEHAGEHRLWPALRDLPGTVGVSVLRGEDNAEVVLSLATSVESIERAVRAILSTELLPDEEPALLAEPDRVLLGRVVDHRAFRVLAGDPS